MAGPGLDTLVLREEFSLSVISDVQFFSTVTSYAMGRRIDWYTYACFLKEAHDAENTKLYTTAQQNQTEHSRITVTTAASQRNVRFNTLCAINKLRTQHALSMNYSSFRV